MKINRTKNAGKNMGMEMLKNIYNILMPFILRTAMIHCLGIEYTGLGGLFASVLDVLNLTELGVGSAMVFSMYKPIAEDDTEKLCALMNLYKKYYRIIGSIILIIGLAITPFIDKLIAGGYPSDINIYILFIMNLMVTVASYWLFAYRVAILNAHQKNYVESRIDLMVSIVFSSLQLISLFVFANYYVFLGLNLLRQITANIIKAWASKKRYPYCMPKGKLKKEETKSINKKIRDLFTSKLGSTITYSADTIVISSFLGLTILARYQNYYYIFTSVLAMAGIVYNATRAGIGNSIICEGKEKNLKDLKNFTFISCMISSICGSCFIVLYQPFIRLWVGEKNLLDYKIPLLLCFMFVLRYFKQLLMTYKDAAGVWHQDRFRPLIAGIANIIMNLIMIQFWGLYGVLLSTIVSEVLIEIPWLIWNIFKTIFNQSWKTYIIKTVKYYLVCIIVLSISFLVTSYIPEVGFVGIASRILFVAVVPIAIFGMVYWKSNEMKVCIDLIKRMARGNS